MVVRPALTRLFLVTAILMFGSSVLAQDDDASLFMFRGDATRSGQMPGPGPDPSFEITELWRFTTGGEVYSSPAVADGVVYVGSDDFSLYALDAATGSELWQFETAGGVSSSPAVVDGVVYVGSRDNYLYALDATSGSERWRFDTGDDVYYSSPAVVKGIVYVGNFAGNIYALDATNGSELWRFITGDYVVSSPAEENGVVYFGSGDGYLIALDGVDGSERWRFAAGGFVQSTPAVANGVVYVGSGDSNVYAIDASNGMERWHFSTGGAVVPSPAVVDGVVFFGSSDARVYAVDAATGSEQWHFDTGGFVQSSPGVVGGVVYVGSFDGIAYALDASNGSELWQFGTEGDVYSSPAVVDFSVYVGSLDGNVYAFGNPAEEKAVARTAEAIVQATTESELAIEQTWTDYFANFGSHLSASEELPLGFTFDDWQYQSQSEIDPTGWSRGALYPVDVLGDGDESSIMLSVYDSNDNVDNAYALITNGLIRAGWRPQEVVGIDHTNACLSLSRDGTSTAVCYVSRDRAIITTYSYLPFDAPAAVLLNASDLAKFADRIYDEVERPS